MEAEEKRQAFRAWLDQNGLSPYSAARKAGISPGTIYNFLSGLTDSLSSRVLEKLAGVTGNTVDAILTGTGATPHIPVSHRIGSGGRMFPVEKEEEGELTVVRPAGLTDPHVSAALIDGDALHPIPAGWAVFFRTSTEDPAALVGALAVVRFSGGGDRAVIRTIRRGSEPGLFTLQAFNGTVTEDVEVLAAHRVVSFGAT